MAPLNLLNISNSPQKVQLLRIAHIYQKHPDLQKWEVFAKDFGFVEAARQGGKIYFRGYGKDPYCVVASASENGQKEFGGVGFIAKTEEDFEKAKKIPGAKLVDISSAPGGGKMVSIPTPTNNFIHVIWGQVERDEPRSPPSTIKVAYKELNTSLEKIRRGEFQRLKHGPALIHKLGHFGYVTKKFDEDVQFYTSNFNFVISDLLSNPKNQDEDVTCFFHLDHGEEYVDHHCLFLARAPGLFPETRLHHTSYEVDDFDTQLMGHEWLLKKSYKLVWGVGRHILGSQIFDYWKDPSGFTIEHYADGDLVNQHHKITREPDGGGLSLAIWGPAFDQIKFAGLSRRDLLQIGIVTFKWPLISVIILAAVALPSLTSVRSLVYNLLYSRGFEMVKLYL
ncbi:glyoxalase family protein [Ilyonectria destructans]|nr:glyoxalase family protein [Ilyonectria destructans]